MEGAASLIRNSQKGRMVGIPDKWICFDLPCGQSTVSPVIQPLGRELSRRVTTCACPEQIVKPGSLWQLGFRFNAEYPLTGCDNPC